MIYNCTENNIIELVCENTTTLNMLWFNFILGLNFIFLCSKLIIIDYHTPN